MRYNCCDRCCYGQLLFGVLGGTDARGYRVVLGGLCDDGMVNMDCKYVRIVVGAVMDLIWVRGEYITLR